MTFYVPTTEHMMGPSDGSAAVSEIIPGDAFRWLGSCDTAHIRPFPSYLGLPPLKLAIWRMCFSQLVGRSIFQLVTCLDGPSSITGVATIDSANKPPGIGVWNTGVEVTDALNAWFAANTAGECNVGFQGKGDNTNPFVIYSSRLELVWTVG